jgi:DNA repair exonuclease SbcCD ATPase subunit
VSTTREPGSPTTAEWLVAIGALFLAAALVFGMVRFAQSANRDTTLVNWFGLVTALGGAATFELVKYAVTIRDRYLNQLSLQINVTPARVETLRSLREDLERTRQMQAALSAAIQLRARELLLAQQREELRNQAARLQNELETLSDQEHRLALDLEARDSESLVQEVQQMIDALESERQKEPLKLIKSSLASFEFVMPGTSKLMDQLVSYVDRQLEKRRARKIRATTADTTAHREHTPKSD